MRVQIHHVYYRVFDKRVGDLSKKIYDRIKYLFHKSKYKTEHRTKHDHSKTQDKDIKQT